MADNETPMVEAIRGRLEKFVSGRSYDFNPDKDMVDSILGAMAKRHAQHGADYCPCRRVTGDRNKDADIICPCIYHEKEVEDDGHCHCHLFTRK